MRRHLLKSPRLTIGLSIVIAVLLVVRWWAVRPKPIVAEAVRLDRAFMEGRADELFDAASPAELQATGLTRESFRRIFAEMIWPRVRRFKPTGPELTESLMSGASGGAYIPCRDSSGHRSEFHIVAYSSDRGPVIVLTHLIGIAWYMDYVDGQGLPQGPDAVYLSRRKGFERDGARLQALGVRGVYDAQEGAVHPWVPLPREGAPPQTTVGST